MLKTIRDKWDKNREELREALACADLDHCDYKDLVKLSFDVIFNERKTGFRDKILDTDIITEIDNGDYQGTLLYLIPFKTYQPAEYEYLMTYVDYGSCSVCDTLMGIQGSCETPLEKQKQISDFMTLCKDILTNTIKPYNCGWREDKDYNQIEVKEEENEL